MYQPHGWIDGIALEKTSPRTPQINFSDPFRITRLKKISNANKLNTNFDHICKQINSKSLSRDLKIKTSIRPVHIFYSQFSLKHIKLHDHDRKYGFRDVGIKIKSQINKERKKEIQKKK